MSCVDVELRLWGCITWCLGAIRDLRSTEKQPTRTTPQHKATTNTSNANLELVAWQFGSLSKQKTWSRQEVAKPWRHGPKLVCQRTDFPNESLGEVSLRMSSGKKNNLHRDDDLCSALCCKERTARGLLDTGLRKSLAGFSADRRQTY